MHHFTAAPRIYHVHPLAMGPIERWGAGFDHAAGMGFDTVLAAPPFDPGRVGNPFLVHDPDRLHPALGHGDARDGLARLAGEARARGLSLMLDLVVDRAAAGGRLAGGEAPDPDALALDPRVDPQTRGAAALSLDAERIAALADRLAGLAEAGVAGFRCLGVERVPPPAWADLIAAVRARAPATRFLAWTPDAPAEARAALEGVGFDAVFVSIARWDGRDAEIVDLAEAQRGVAPAVGCPEEPFGDRVARHADGGEEARRAAGRMLWLAAALGDGLMVPMGFEFGVRERMAVAGPAPDLDALRGRADFDLGPEIAAANAFLARHGGDFAGAGMRALTGAGAPVAALVRSRPGGGPDRRARLVVANPDLRFGATLDAGAILERTGGVARFTDIAGTLSIAGAAVLRLGPAEVRVMEGEPEGPVLGAAGAMSLEEAVAAPRFAIEAVTPSVDGGRHPVKRTVGDVVAVEADLVGDGHDRLAAALLFRAADAAEWREARMRPLGNDRWAAEMPLERLGRHVYTVEVWKDAFETFRDELTKKHAAGLRVSLELEEGRRLLADTLEKGAGPEGARDRLGRILARLADADDAVRLAILLDPETAELMRETDPRRFRHRLDPPVAVDAERVAASFAAWYELFPRSMSGDPKRHGTFDDVIRALPRVRSMGFDVLYFPPIHPIGRTARKGRNNALKAGPDDPGSPYAIGSPEGGHDAVHPELGTLDDFRRLVAAAADHGLEIALDFAIQCSPDHPWLKQHPEWFDWRPDGSIRTAENPPKKYEDIVNVDFYAEGAIPSLWTALRDVVEFWIGEGVRLFRVDNPHTKTFPFWEWLIADVRGRHPDAVFLAEAFTRPKVMYRLAKIGFSQSYTYFTWRNTKHELTAYLEELTREAPRDFFRPHFFVNTPDINPAFLQNAPRPAYLIRAALAATLSGLWGVYNGFEICEGRPVPGKEEYLDSEKYEIRAWDWTRPGNIVAEITRLNRIRRDNPALWSHLGVAFLPAGNDRVLWYRKATDARDSVVLVAVSLDPHEPQEAGIELPLWEFGLSDRGRLDLTDLMRGTRFSLAGKHQRIRLDPHDLPFAIWRVDAAREG